MTKRFHLGPCSRKRPMVGAGGWVGSHERGTPVSLSSGPAHPRRAVRETATDEGMFLYSADCTVEGEAMATFVDHVAHRVSTTESTVLCVDASKGKTQSDRVMATSTLDSAHTS